MSITPISYDIDISLSRSSTLTPTDMTLQCFNTPNVDFLVGERVQFFSDSDSFYEITSTGSSVYWAGNAFFGLTDRPARIAVGRIFTSDQPAYVLSADIDFDALASVSAGAFSIAVNGTRYETTPADFSLATTVNQVVEILNQANSSSQYIAEAYNGNLILKSIATGENAVIGYASAPTSSSVTTAAVMTGSEITISDLTSISDGSFTIDVSGSSIEVSGLDFSSVENMAGIVSLLSDKISGVTVSYSGNSLVLTTTATGTGVYFTQATAGSSGTDVSDYLGLADATIVNGTTTTVTDISDILGLTASSGATLESTGYTAGDLSSELTANKNYIESMGANAYAWSIDREYRDTSEAQDFVNWVSNLSYEGFACITTNLASVLSSSDTSSIAYYCNANNIQNVATFYHDNEQYYPDVAYIATLQAVDYSLADSVIDMKFKDLGTIPAVSFSSLTTQLAILENKRCNTITYWGTTDALCTRNGDNASSLWRSDLWVNTCNFIAELKTNVANVFLRNKKVPYTIAGQTLLTSAITSTCNTYVTNGSYADREYEDSTSENGVSLQKAYEITPTAISSMTAAQRRAGTGTPYSIVLNDSGSMRTVSISIEVVD